MSRSQRHPSDASADPRALAWEILRRVEDGGAYADVLIGHQLTGSALSARDQALATRLVYGTLAWQGYLDHLIGAYSRRPPQALETPVRTLLRLAALQICVLTKIPPFAAVNTAVHLAKQFRGGAAAGLVNAVLRRLARGWQEVALPPRDSDALGYLATRWSHPPWLVERWLTAYGFDETEALLRANNDAAPTVLRVNRRRIDREQLLAHLRQAGYVAAPTVYSAIGVAIDGGAPQAMPGWADGLFSLQGEASQLVGLLVAPQPGARLLDACAAPGGKATQLAELMDDRGTVVALDIHPRGVERITQAAHRLGLTSVRTVIADATVWTPRGGGFDGILVDAPCSGLGTLRQHPEVKWRRTPADVAALSTLQLALLRHNADNVRRGGTLVYSTCTISAAENEQVIAAFLKARPDFAVDDPRPLLPAAAQSLVGADGALRTFPHRHGLDGFFAVRCTRRD